MPLPRPDQIRMRSVLSELVIKYQWPRSAKVLDIGCGPLRPYSEFLIGQFDKYVGADSNRKCIRQAREKIGYPKHVVLTVEDVHQLSAADHEYDLVVCNDMLAYTDKFKALKEIQRVLKPGGMCISIANNSIGYSWYKILHPMKFWPIEVAHTMAVVFNTWLFRCFGLKFFHTTYNTRQELERTLQRQNWHAIHVWFDHNIRPYETYNFVARKPQRIESKTLQRGHR